MKLTFFLVFVSIVSAFDFDIPVFPNNVSDNSTTGTSIAETKTTTSSTSTTTSTTTTSTTSTTPNETRPTLPKAAEEKENSPSAEQLTFPETTGKVEVVVTQSIFRLLDEAFRNRLINFESRIATLLHQREMIKDEIQDFSTKIEDEFFSDFFAQNERLKHIFKRSLLKKYVFTSYFKTVFI
jgi:LAS superfamily LD-carboxypeptidase LdcB